MFFECNLPQNPPIHLEGQLRKEFSDTVRRIRARMDKLETALNLSGMRPEIFQLITSDLFKKEGQAGDVAHFDGMTPEDLSKYANMVCTGKETAEDRLIFPNADVLFDAAYATVHEWEVMRHIGLGGSDSAVIQLRSKYRTPRALYYDKIGVDIPKAPEKTAIFQRGHILEDTVISLFCERVGAVRIRDTRMFRSKTHPHCIADIDAMLKMPDGSLYLFEAKSAASEKKKDWTGGKVPPDYAVQTHHYPAVLADNRIKGTYIGCLFVNDYSMFNNYVGSVYDCSQFISALEPRDADIEKNILDSNEDWWNQYVEADTLPDLLPEMDAELVESIAGEPDGELPPLDWSQKPEIQMIVARYLDIQEREKTLSTECDRLKKEKEAVALDLKDKLGKSTEATCFYCGKPVSVKWGLPTQRKETDYETLLALYPSVYDKVVSSAKTKRRFSVRILKEK